MLNRAIVGNFNSNKPNFFSDIQYFHITNVQIIAVQLVVILLTSSTASEALPAGAQPMLTHKCIPFLHAVNVQICLFKMVYSGIY